MIRIAVCAPSTPITSADAERVKALALAEFPQLDLVIHEQCFAEEGHFAGSDDVRTAALVECANDPSVDAVWFARGGYGACRIAEAVLERFDHAAQGKTFLGYSDAGNLLGGLYRERIGRPVHAPMLADIRREGGEDAVRRTLAFVSGERSGLEPSLAGEKHPVVAFNLMTLAMLCGTRLMPGLAGHVVMVEEVSEYLYAVDRLFFHLTAHLGGIAGLRLGRVSDVPGNDRPFGSDVPEIARYWCDRHAIPFLGSADIGHDAANRIVPFGLAEAGQGQ
ncbi:LD-carboxypeptidase [Novosphingobium mangrovi (ex Huang et al. 2023)]|uniref:LD-carboxypeptidase n=1 Tax=Novosphingobium mangrovi (ex Huang et al. 2023) TaxID=2976432 RepID=A0ABT2I6C7_9SPHN|nr:LD-carboxypeptidase [Novosphingobium mangrovi (ex Huang et al. 2023)]MCT2400364.1 LD-carboxypeptidase [Novosphingobium mangrovi (ex Huang et al. 2023)]